MKRYSACLRLEATWAGSALARKAIARELALLEPGRTLAFGAYERNDDHALLEIKSEAGRGSIVRVLHELEGELGMQCESVGWGWLVSAGAPETGQDSDPYASAAPQAGLRQVYEFGAGNWVAVGLAGGLLLFVGVLLALNDPLINPICTIGGLVLVVLFVRGLLDHVTSVCCDDEGVELRYWYRVRRRLSWSEIEGLQLLPLGPDTCFVEGKGTALRFPFDNLSGLKSRPELVRTIVERAGLRFVERGFTARNSARTGYFVTYKRFDAQR